MSNDWVFDEGLFLNWNDKLVFCGKPSELLPQLLRILPVASEWLGEVALHDHTDIRQVEQIIWKLFQNGLFQEISVRQFPVARQVSWEYHFGTQKHPAHLQVSVCTNEVPGRESSVTIHLLHASTGTRFKDVINREVFAEEAGWVHEPAPSECDEE